MKSGRGSENRGRGNGNIGRGNRNIGGGSGNRGGGGGNRGGGSGNRGGGIGNRGGGSGNRGGGSVQRGGGNLQSGGVANWICSQCLYDNFPSRQTCHKCKVPRSSVSGNYSSPFNNPLASGSYSTAVGNSSSVGRNYLTGHSNVQKHHATKGAGNNQNQSHTGNFTNSNQNNSSSNNVRKETDYETLIRSLGRKNITHQHIEDNISSSLHVWFMCWENIDQLPPSSLEIMITALAKISYSVIQSVTPSIVYCRMGVEKFFLSVRSLPDTNLVLNKVEIVFNMIKKILSIEWKEDTEIVKIELKKMLSLSISFLKAEVPDHFKTIQSIMETMSTLDKPWVIKAVKTLKTVENSTSLIETASECSSWQNVNVSWLANVELFQPTLLPVMKVPSNKSGGVYKNPEEYFEIVMRLWIGLTFNDGNSNLNPRCHHKFGEKECGEVMLPNKSDIGNLYCSRNCQSPVVLHCPDSRHNKGLCVKCAEKAKKELMGPAGPNASTNIYDCQVTRVEYDGRVYMNNVESRKPPYQKAIHWKSTRRLSSANLVGLVKLSYKGSCLKENDTIIWGEIVNHGEQRDEFRRREEKRLCVSLSTINETKFTDFIKKHDYLAVIDCMTFVPEHIPILKALDIQKVSNLPFQEGALLNIGKQKDITNFEDFSYKLNNFMNELTPSFNFTKSPITTAGMIVDLIIDQSQIDPIIRIRRDEVISAKLRAKLTSLVSSTTLDSKQLQSFAEAFVEPVHLTQGPPGTGKSYLGVVIVRALLIIQELWNSVDSTVGMHPILVLSYKNHAIDEFLTDLVKAEHHVNLIRIGNSDEQALHRYSEKNFKSSDYMVDCIKNQLQSLLKQKEDYQNFQKSLSPMLAYDLFVNPNSHDKTDEKDKKIASYNAAFFLHNLIANVKQLTEFLSEKDTDEFGKLKTVWNEVMSKQSKKTLNESDIQNLWNGIKHYNDKMDFCDVILNWIDGVEPLPKCSFNNQCNNIVCNKTVSLCYEHKCKFKSCQSAHLESHLLCKEHACQANGCKMIKLPSPQIFCDKHACFICLQKNLVAHKCIGSPPRNSCLNHPLCNFKENNKNNYCVSLALIDKFYCADHINKVCSVKDCNQSAFSHKENIVSSAPLCHKHKCKFESCRLAPLENNIMCAEHACKETSCKFVKLPAPQNFCKEHACFICLKENTVALCSTDIAPRNTCSKHPLCAYTMQNKPCINLALSKTSYCEEHSVKYCSEKHCKNVALSHSESYCEIHKPKCIAKNKKGNKCKNSCKKGYMYCDHHVTNYKASPISIAEVSLNDQTPQVLNKNNMQPDGNNNANIKSTSSNNKINANNKMDHQQKLCEKKNCENFVSQNEVHCKVHKCIGVNKKKKPCNGIRKQGYEYCSDHVKNYNALPISDNINSKVGQTVENTNLLTETSDDSGLNTYEANIFEDRTTDTDRNVNVVSNLKEGIAVVNCTLLNGEKPKDTKGYAEKFNTEFEEKNSKKLEENENNELHEINSKEFEKFDTIKHKVNSTIELEEIDKNYSTDDKDDYHHDSVEANIDEEHFIEESFKKEDDDDINDEPANYQHMRDVYFEDENYDDQIEEEEIPLKNQVELNKADELKSTLSPEKWSWEMSLEDRWYQCKLLEKEFYLLLSKLEEIRNLKIKILRKNHHEEKIKAKTRVYERKAVIGGTIVGCIARLEAIRNTKPFAILVEEASEVLEPLVFSCLTDTTCKLEMIGDHLQLKPSVMSKIMFERRNKINTSMFERLICAPKNHSVPSSVLSTQRRMRKNICDLTRSFYNEIVDIEDHSICSSRKIGDSNVSAAGKKWSTNVSLFEKLKLCIGKGREVPGVLPHIFFWTHGGTQTKASVGLSRINSTEAKMVIGLTEYLVSCGVPKASIAILTPYKGQLMLIRSDLMKLNLLNNKDVADSVVLSTVDRFQGDEADVVIISLVIDEKSQTGFVKEVNRMIVLLSRARLGMYIIGNINYFEAKPDKSICHWTDTLTKLKEPCESDTSQEIYLNADEHHYSGPRLGNKLPICCPVHRGKTIHYAESVQQLNLNFCQEMCSHTLPCTHPCGFPCHFLNKDNHNTLCSVQITPPPCEIHMKDLTCRDVYLNIGKMFNLGIGEALKNYKCPEVVSVQLPCTHSTKMKCWEENEIAEGKRSYPECKQLAHNPYVYQKCRHELTVLCVVYDECMKDPSKVKPCKFNLTYNPPCTHLVTIPCYLKQQYEDSSVRFHCNQKVDINLPRCGHKANVSCDVSQTLNNWSGESSKTGIVYEGRSYGPIDLICKEIVDFVHICKHIRKIECHLAFEQASKLSKCFQNVDVKNPNCGHPATINCYQTQLLQSFTTKNPVNEVREGQTSLVCNNPIPHHKCTSEVLFFRKCGHTEKMQCYQARDGNIQPCQIFVETENAICGHKISLPCHLLSELKDWLPWKNKDRNNFFFNNVLSDDCPAPIFPSNQLFKYAKNCKNTIVVQRKNCGHQYKINCGVAFKELDKTTLRICDELINEAILNCGHTKTMSCSSYTDYKQLPEKYSCTEEVIMSCWNSENCKQQVVTVCNKQNKVYNCKKLTDWNCLNGHTIPKLPICQKGLLSECAECVFEVSKNCISNVAKSLDLLAFLPNELHPFVSEKLVSKECLHDFLLSQNKLVEDLSSWLSKQKPLKRPLIEFTYFPCFIWLAEHQLNLEVYPKNIFTKASNFNGIQVCEWTLNNIENLMTEANKKKEKSLEIIFGVALICNTKVVSEKMTKSIKKSITGIQNNVINNGFDSLQYCNNKWEYLILWNPHVFAATHKLKFQISQLKHFYDQLRQSQDAGLWTKRNLNQKFPQQFIPQDASSFVVEKNAKKFSEQLLRLNMIAEYDGIKFQVDWDGKSLGRAEIFNEHIQKDLMSKLQFCAVKGLSDKQANLFSGINYLKILPELLKQKDLPEINLLTSLEKCKLEYFDDAETELNEYIECVKRKKVLLHPFFFLAKSRIAFHKKNLDISRNFLNQFSKFHSKALKKWCEDKEINLLNDETDSNLQVIPAVSNINDPISKWNNLKDQEGVTSAAMDTLVKLTGLKKVKEFAIDLFKFSLKFSQLSTEAKSANQKTLNFCFLGNAGSGKTTVARLLAEILKDTGLRSSNTFVESSAQKLKDEGPDKFRNLAASAKNGVLFIDEAYDLDPKGDSKGKPIVSELLVISENDREHLSIILAGYEDDMNEKLFSYNEGIKSRFEMVHFEDFDESELKTIWIGEIEKRKFICDDSVSTVVSKRLAKMSGKKGFGNARAVRKEIEKAIQTAMARENLDPSNLIINIEDVVGESPLDNLKLKAILQEFDDKIGWKAVKKSVNQLIEICKTNFTLQLMGKKTLPIMLNRLFLGNPGTGKTTCAKLYGRLLKELNFLSIGDVIISTASDFVGSHVGESPKKTNAMLEKARGKVLVIDEAYNLNDKLFGKEVLDVLVEKVQNTESDDIAVLLLGYEPQMREMLREQNPGLARRFAMDYAFVFEDYSESELFVILKGVCKRENIQMSIEVSEAILKLLEKQRAQANFGNAGAIDNVVRAALAKASSRPLTSDGMIKLIPSDIGDGNVENEKEKSSDPFAPLEKLYRVENIRQQLIEIKNTFQVAQTECSKDRPELGHFVFQGAPGTGKTTVARVMAEILFDLGLLPRNHVEETSGLGLTGEYVGQTKKRVKDKLDSARGGILFIDEAYELGKGHFGEEAITTLVAAMTDPNYKLVIIIAGYPQDIDQMLSVNVGLKSRFKRFMNFEDWNSNDCLEFLQKKASADNYGFDSDVKNSLHEGLEELRSFPGWGNARDVIALWQKILEHRANRVVQAPEVKKSILRSDALKALEVMIKDRRPKVNNRFARNGTTQQLKRTKNEQQFQNDFKPTKMSNKSSINDNISNDNKQTNNCVNLKENNVEHVDSDDIRDPGVPDEIWKQLQVAKLAKKEEEKMKEEKAAEEKRFQEEQEKLLNELLRELQEEREEEKRQQMLRELEKKREEERKRREAEEKRLNEERQKAKDVENAIRKLCPCPAGYSWYKQGGGWRCGGGSHFVSDEQLQRQFTTSV
ncbi:uncharacterized protein LOC100206283 isoform X3 [Hydra vulgaris]|uniref:Uncharacterized protein LOC100206283 isoform X3 n=1 Tax=Hydra vulgaris TaxID=6087 RepID=A0ABM4CJJ1_HYDVU